ncbi:hypothetical protein ACE1B6_11895 [Aerosakkonemataceae cyanobacterium BLCC-F154]|uniref:SGNH hydrolase-type esterase domain-containing protein n=1 Tax=Floridaenema fluviatile BLCC-F154 TaxID=3153640 RepID=A0ABV4YAV8_9CYAN
MMPKSSQLIRLTLILSITALLTSVVLNVILFIAARHFYLLLNQTRLDPLGWQRFSDKSQSVDLSNNSQTKVVFFGDSRAEEWTFPSEIKGFYVLGRLAKQVLPLRPQIIIVQVGINDLKTIPLFPDRQTRIIDIR